jgi:hypothetical protein
LRGESLEQMIRQKFSYVVSCQAYGQHKKARDPKAADTEFLVQRFRNLRVAYVDKAVTFAQVRVRVRVRVSGRGRGRAHPHPHPNPNPNPNPGAQRRRQPWRDA